MDVPPPDLSGHAAASRRAFLGCCSALALAYAGCARLSPETRTAYALISDPSVARYRPILDGLIRAILPFEQPQFPVSPEDVRARLLTLFRLETDARLLVLQKTLVLFDQPDLFRHRLVMAGDERRSVDADARGLDVTALMATSHAHDTELYDAFVRGGREDVTSFTRLGLARQREYLDLWRRSGFNIRRQFYASARALVMISAYSMDAVWRAIDYGGPFVRQDKT